MGVPTADVVERGPREPVTRGLAAPVLQLTDCAQRRRPARTEEVSHLAVGDGRQRDFNRGFYSSRRSSAISLRRSSPSGTTRPARKSAKPSSEPSRAAWSRRMRITWASSCRSSALSRMRSKARFVSATRRTASAASRRRP